MRWRMNWFRRPTKRTGESNNPLSLRLALTWRRLTGPAGNDAGRQLKGHVSNLKQNYSLPDGTLKPIRKPARDPMVIQMERAYRSSKQWQLDKLLHKQMLYRKRLTLAQAGLERVQKDIYEYLLALSKVRLAEKSEDGE